MKDIRLEDYRRFPRDYRQQVTVRDNRPRKKVHPLSIEMRDEAGKLETVIRFDSGAGKGKRG